MALTDEEKLEVVRNAVKQKIMSFSDWTEFKTFLQNLTAAQIKTFILNKLQTQASIASTESDDLGSLYTEVNSDV